GLRPDAIETAGATVLLDLIAGGSFQATAVNEIPPVTLPNHASMVTGQSVARHGVLLNTDLPGRATL
ncbi:MAG: alkaline phosphatase family protein, partial [Planctomycetota bacterium]|nr:alkaline phosphatase family protein [Planctomycetota bacterium]